MPLSQLFRLDPNSPAQSGGQAPPSAPPDPQPAAPPSAPATPAPAEPVAQSDDFPSDTEFADALAAAQAQQPNQPSAPAPQAPAGSPPPGQGAAPQSALMQSLREAGIDPSQFADESAAIQALATRYQEYDQILPYAQYGYQVQPYRHVLERHMSGQGAQQPAAPQAPAAPQPEQWSPESHFKKLWSAPQYDPDWQHLVTFDPQTNRYVGITPEVPMEIVQGVNNYSNWLKKQQREFFDNPYQRTFEAVREPLLREVQNVIQQTLQGQQQQQQLAHFEQQNARVLYQADQNGNLVVDPMTGQARMTPFGQRFYSHANHLFQQGLRDQGQIVELAKNLALGEFAVAEYQQRQQQPVANGSNGHPAPNGAPPVNGNGQPAPAADPVAASQQQQQTFLQNALQRAGHVPSGGGGAAEDPSSDPTFETSLDMEGFLEREARRTGLIR